MRLRSFEVQEFRSVQNSGVITVGDITCLVGKNEAGKTALLKALYRLNPVVDDDATFSVTDDYPRKQVNDYENDVADKKRQQATPIRATFVLDEEEVAAVAAVFGDDFLKKPEITVSKAYDGTRSFLMPCDDKAARTHLSANSALPEELRERLKVVADWGAFSAALAAAEATPEITKLKELLPRLIEHGAPHYAYNILLRDRLPKFLYFDEYYQMAGHENVAALIQRRNGNNLQKSDYPLLGLINLARLKLDELLNVKRTLELTNTLEGAGNRLTRQILKYWSQNKHLQMKFDVREAKPEDPPHMRSGVNIWGKVYDTVHWATTELGSRSRGFVWFFSFLAWYEDVKREGKDLILLLDEPGLSLHGKAQADLLRYFEEELKPHNQIIYSTHSPFMVDPANFSRVRIVQDKSVDSDTPLSDDSEGTQVVEHIYDASEDSLFPLQGALGYELHQTLFIGPNCLVVEGPEDMLFLKGMSSVIEREGGTGLSPKWVITPVGGSGKVPTFVALLAPQRGLRIVTLLDIQASDRQQVEFLYKKRLLQKKHVLTYADFTGTKEADVADMFDRSFYLSLVNAEYATTLQSPIEEGHLNAKIPRVLYALEEVLTKAPLKSGSFGHYRPARYFSENLASLTPQLSVATKERFADAFKRINEQLK